MRATFSAISLALLAGSLAAQQPNASPAATALGNAYTARARGYDAVAWNPANLAMPGNPAFSLTVLAVQGSSGLDPISLSDLAPYSGKTLPATQRETWLQKATASGGENGRLDAGVTGLALSAGPIGLQVATSVTGTTKLNPDAFEAILFGNAGRTGQPRDLNLAGSNVHVGVFTTGALSYALSLGGDAKSDSHLALGITGKYVMGNAVAMAQDQGTTSNTNGVSLNFPMVYSNTDSTKMPGKGVGMDLGLAWSQGKLSFGASVQNVFNTFAWDETKLLSKTGFGLFNAAVDTSDFDDKPYVQAPAALRQKIADDKFKPILAAGVAYAWRPSIILSADARQQMGDQLLIGPRTSIGGGIDYRWLPILRLRGGASYITDGWGASGGVGLEFGHYELGVGVAMQTVNSGKSPAITLNVLSIH